MKPHNRFFITAGLLILNIAEQVNFQKNNVNESADFI